MTNSTPTSKFVTDTMGLILRMEHRKLSRQVKDIFDKEVFGDRQNFHLPAVGSKQGRRLTMGRADSMLWMTNNC
jgi:hypothetical protein